MFFNKYLYDALVFINFFISQSMRLMYAQSYMHITASEYNEGRKQAKIRETLGVDNGNIGWVRRMITYDIIRGGGNQKTIDNVMC